MKLISHENLVKGETYYIECTSLFEGKSGKKIGIFNEFEYPFGPNPPFARFSKLRDLPNSTKQSGMGTVSTNIYSTLNCIFYLPEKDEIYENNYLKNIINKYTGTNIGSYICRPLYLCASHPVDNKTVEAVDIVKNKPGLENHTIERGLENRYKNYKTVA
jgi:hypothetical protein